MKNIGNFTNDIFVYEQLCTSLDEGQEKLLQKYIDSVNEDRKQENALAYYLGLRAGISLQKLK